MEKQLTVRQARARMLDIHFKLLAAVACRQPLSTARWSAGEYFGAKTARRTLLRWGCFEGEGLSEFGRELLEEARGKFPALAQRYETSV